MAVVRWRPFSAAERWEPFQGMSDLQSEMNRRFDDAFGRLFPSTVADRALAPLVDMYETKDDLVLMVELPGVSEKDIMLSITGEMLSLRGERRPPEAKQEGYYRAERWFGKFERTVGLPLPVQADRVKATYQDGVLKVVLPKAEAIRPKEIKIDVI